MKLKRFLVFAGDHYYPKGGFNDLVGSKNTLEAAIELAKSQNTDWYQVIDIHLNSVVRGAVV